MKTKVCRGFLQSPPAWMTPVLSSSFSLDPSITRGLDYYTGVVFETFLSELPAIGSVCSAAGTTTSPPSTRTRGCPAWSIHRHRPPDGGNRRAGPRSVRHIRSVPAHCVPRGAACGRLPQEGGSLSGGGNPGGSLPEQKKLAVQFTYAEKRGIPLPLAIGEKESGEGIVGLKDLRSRQSYDGLTLETAIGKAKELLR